MGSPALACTLTPNILCLYSTASCVPSSQGICFHTRPILHIYFCQSNKKFSYTKKLLFTVIYAKLWLFDMISENSKLRVATSSLGKFQLQLNQVETQFQVRLEKFRERKSDKFQSQGLAKSLQNQQPTTSNRNALFPGLQDVGTTSAFRSLKEVNSIRLLHPASCLFLQVLKLASI